MKAFLPGFFSPDQPIYTARAPGRLDVMGGIADYSGARVLQLPLACATTASVQPQVARHCDIATNRGGRWDRFSIVLPLAEPDELAAWFREHEAERWAGYVVGVVQALLARSSVAGGMRILIESTVPEGRGVASSAALEVAVATAVAAACEIGIESTELAALCQRVENHVVGAPCGIMDQVTSACGKQDKLLQLLCQPGTIEGYLDIPDGYRFYGIDSGVSHAVSGADYGTVRTAAFMGLRIITTETTWRGAYLANLTRAEFAQFARLLPEQMTGAEFLQQYGDIADSATSVVPERRYPVRQATRHPVGEQERVDDFARLLAALPDDPGVAPELGQLMYGSHGSYSACGLGSEATNRLVEMVMAVGPKSGLFGAKITGGGSGGTVAIFGTRAAEQLVRNIAAQYSADTGRQPLVFVESGELRRQTAPDYVT